MSAVKGLHLPPSEPPPREPLPLSPRERDEIEWQQERHQRRMQLMRMQGEVNRQEHRAHIMIVIGVIGLITALALV